jgi:hypothetical protein
MVVRVTRSWDQVKLIRTTTTRWEKSGGQLGKNRYNSNTTLTNLVLALRMAELDPHTLGLEDFGFRARRGFPCLPRFEARALVMVDMVDLAVGFLGPDLEPLEEDLKVLGVRHIKYGVQPEYLPLMLGKSLLYSLRNILKEKLTAEDELAWETVFDFLVLHMTKVVKGDH